MSHLKEMRNLRKIATKATTQYPLTHCQIDFIALAENAIYKITAKTGTYLLRIHANGYRTPLAIEQELGYIDQLREVGFQLQKPLKSTNDNYVTVIDGRMVTLLGWQLGQKKYKSIRDRHFEKLGAYLAKLHSFSKQKNHKIASDHRQYWTSDNLIGTNPIFGSFTGLEKIVGFEK